MDGDRSSSFNIIRFFALLYPICPSYFYIGGLQFRDFFLLLILGIILMTRKSLKIHFSYKTLGLILTILIWSGITSVIGLLHSELHNALVQICLWCCLVVFISSEINTRDKFLKIIDTLILAGCVVGIFGLIEEVTRFNIFVLLNNANTTLNYNPERFGIFRIISFTSHAITYCLYCGLILTLIFYRITTLHNSKR